MSFPYSKAKLGQNLVNYSQYFGSKYFKRKLQTNQATDSQVLIF